MFCESEDLSIILLLTSVKQAWTARPLKMGKMGKSVLYMSRTNNFSLSGSHLCTHSIQYFTMLKLY